MPPDFTIDDPALARLLPSGARLERLATGAIWSEGPVYFAADDSVVWSDIPNNRMLRWSARDGMSIFRAPSGFTNGHTLDREGRLVSCSHGHRRLERTEADGRVITLVEHFEGKRLNSPNDVVVKSDGTIWFTDPPYGIVSNVEGHAAPSELGVCHVFRFDPDTAILTSMTGALQEPNGLAFSPDESKLYVSDTSIAQGRGEHHHVFVFDVIDGRHLAHGRVFAPIEPGVADGFRLDTDGNLYISSADSIQVYAPDGHRLGKIAVPEKVANCTFGGTAGNRLFIAASASLYAITLNAEGMRRPTR
ncbi:MAG: SMP-30/gluconolactonase/LRE family protein [Betaproteobacteria bacterium]